MWHTCEGCALGQRSQLQLLRTAPRRLHFPGCQVGDVAIVHTYGPKPEMSLCVIEFLQHNVKKKLGWEPKHVIHRKNEIVEHCGIQVCGGCVITKNVPCFVPLRTDNSSFAVPAGGSVSGRAPADHGRSLQGAGACACWPGCGHSAASAACKRVPTYGFLLACRRTRGPCIAGCCASRTSWALGPVGPAARTSGGTRGPTKTESWQNTFFNCFSWWSY